MQPQNLTPNTVYIPWRERAFLTIQETAEILARSPDWVRVRIEMGDLDGARHMQGAPLVVTVPSVLRFIAGIERVARQAPHRAVGRAHLTVVANNT